MAPHSLHLRITVARVPDGEDVAIAELDFSRLERLRRELPALQHARLLDRA